MKKFIALALMALALCTAFALGAFAADDVSTYTAPYCTTAPTVDGKIAEEEWDAAEWATVGCPHPGAEDAAAGVTETKFKVMHDAEYVYVLFQVSDVVSFGQICACFSDEISADLAPTNLIQYEGTSYAPWAVRGNDTSLITEGEGKHGISADGVVVEMKLTYKGGVPASTVFNATATYVINNGYYNYYWNQKVDANSWKNSNSAEYGKLVFAAENAGAEDGENAGDNEGAGDNTGSPETFDALSAVVLLTAVSGMGVVLTKKTRR